MGLALVHFQKYWLLRKCPDQVFLASTSPLIDLFLPVGLGPSLKMWPRWEPQFLQQTSVRISSGLLTISSKFPPTPDYGNSGYEVSRPDITFV